MTLTPISRSFGTVSSVLSSSTICHRKQVRRSGHTHGRRKFAIPLSGTCLQGRWCLAPPFDVVVPIAEPEMDRCYERCVTRSASAGLLHPTTKGLRCGSQHPPAFEFWS